MREPLKHFPRLSGIALAFALAGIAPLASAQADHLNLLQVWQKARSSDAGWRVAQADAQVEREEEKKALAGLLPSIGFSSSRSRNNADIDGPSGSVNYSGYTASNSSLILRQPLFRAQNYAEYRRAGVQKNVADHRLAAEEQALAVRVSQAYFDVLLADDRVRFAGFLESALSTRVEAARKMFRAGSGTTIDIEEASARLRVAQSTKLAAENEAENARKRLATLIDMPVSRIAPMSSEKLVKHSLSPSGLSEWQEQARRNNPELAAAIKSTEEAGWAVDKARAGHLPTVDLVMARTRTESDTTSTISNRIDSNSLGVQLNIPIFGGGYTTSETAQARAKQERSQAAKNGIERELDSRILKEFNGVMHGQQQAEAMAQALQASREALRQTRKGIEAGTRTNLDVLNAEQQLFSVQVEAAKARYEASMSRIRLYAAAGKLNEGELAEINAMMLSPGDAPAADIPTPRVASVQAPQSSREMLEQELNRDVPTARNRKTAEIAASRDARPPKLSEAAEPVTGKVNAKVLTTQSAANSPKVAEVAQSKAEMPPPSPPPSPAPVLAPAAKAEAAAAPLIPPVNKGSHMILVGSFGMADNVKSMLQKLEKAGVPAFTESTGNGQTGVRAGPFKNKAEANAALKKLQKAKIEGVVKER